MRVGVALSVFQAANQTDCPCRAGGKTSAAGLEYLRAPAIIAKMVVIVNAVLMLTDADRAAIVAAVVKIPVGVYTYRL